MQSAGAGRRELRYAARHSESVFLPLALSSLHTRCVVSKLEHPPDPPSPRRRSPRASAGSSLTVRRLEHLLRSPPPPLN